MSAALRPLAFALACLGLAGCMVGPDYERTSHELPPALAPDLARVASASAAQPLFTNDEVRERWWEVFDDERLDRLIELARGQNLGLRAAVARVHASRAVVEQAFGELLPTVSAKAGHTYQKQSLSSFRGLGGSNSSFLSDDADAPFQLWSAQAEMSYELDLWGKVRRGQEAALAESLASDEDRKAAEISLVAEVVQAYFDLAQADASLRIAEEAIALRAQSLALVRARNRTGLADELELRRAEGELEAARADAPEARRLRLVAEHRLAVLLGRPPGVRFGVEPPLAFALPPEVPLGVPAALLERRPDVRAAELRARAANERIGQVKAEFFPSVRILGSFGYASIDIGTLTYGISQLWSLGPSITIPLFEGGRTYQRYEEAQHSEQAAVADYRQVVLVALREVADALAGIRAQIEIRDRQAAANAALAQAVRLAEARYRRGLTDYLNVLDAQRSLLSARRALIQAQRALLSEIVQLHEALGGGWSELPPAEEEQDPPAEE